MAQNDIYLVRQKADGTFEEIAHSPFQYDASSITDLPDKASNTFHINTKLRVDELEVNGKTTVIHTDTNTSEQLLVTNDGTGPAAIINQLGQQALIDIQDDGHSALYIRGDAPFGGFVGLGETNPQEQLHLSGSMLLENTQLLMSKNVSGTKVNILGLTNDDVTNLNNVGNGITLSTGTASSEEKVFIHPSGRVGIGILKNDPGAVLELKRDSDTNLLFTHKTTSISSIINIDKPEDKVVFKTLSDNDLSLGTNALDFFTLTKEGNITLEQKTSGSTLTGGDLTIDGTFTSKGDMISVGSEEILFSKSLTSSGMNVAKSYRVLEVGYNTHHWDHGTSFVVEVYSNHYSSQGYQKYLLSHTYLDTSAGGSQDGIVDKTGSRDYVLKILEHEGDAGSYEFRVRLGSPEDTGVNVNDFDIALVPLYVDVTNYANVRVKVTSFNSDSCKRISFDSSWGAATADDEFKFNPLPPAEDITWSDYPDLPGTLDYVFAGRQALYADVLFGDGRINRIGEGTTHQNNIQWSLKLADTNVSMTVPGNVGIGTASPDEALHVKTSTPPVQMLAERSNAQHSLFSAKNSRTSDNQVYFGLTPGGDFGVGHSLNVDSEGSFFIKPDGDVGIGTPTPDEKLHISGTVKATRAKLADLDIRSFTEATAGDIGDLLSATNTSKFGTIIETDPNGQMIFGIRGNDENDAFRILTKNYVASTTNEASRPYNHNAFCVESSGNVGIGTSEPSYKLEVHGGHETNDLVFTNFDSAGANPQFGFNKAGMGRAALISFNDTLDPNGDLLRYSIRHGNYATTSYEDTDVLQIHNATSEVITLTQDGNVGIGQPNPGAKLEVKLGKNGFPNSDVSEDDVTAFRVKGNDNAVIDMGINGGLGGWVQSRNWQADSLPYPLCLNPLGGNVGIGTTSPEEALHIKGTAPIIKLTDTNTNLSSLLYGDTGMGSLIFVADSTGGGTNQFISFRTQGTSITDEKLRITDSGNVGIGTSAPSEKLHISAGKLLVAAYDIPIAVGDDSVAGATFFSRREPTSGARYGSGIDIVPISEEGNCSPFIRFYDTATNADYDDTIVGDNNWAIGADDSGVASFNINWGGGANSAKPTSIVGSSANSGTNRLSIDGPTGVATFSGPLSIAEVIRHTGDTNTYFGFPNTDQFSVVTNSSTRLLITATATTVNNVLQAHGGMTIATNEDSNTPELTLKRFASTSASGSDDIVDIRVADGGLNFIINNDADADSGTYQFQKMAGGLTVPAAINCGTITTNGIIRKNGDTNTYLEFHSADRLRLVTGGVQQLEVTNSGLFIQDFIKHTGDDNTYFGFHNNDQWRVVTGGSERLEVTNTAISLRSNTGITGDLTISGDLTVNGDVVTLNTTNLQIEDKLLTVAKNASNAATADGCGFDFGGQYKLTFQDESTNKLVIEDTSANTASLEIQGTGGAQLVLQDTNSSNTANQTGLVAWKLGNNTLTAEVGFRSNSDSDFSIRNGSGDIVLLGQDTRLTGTGNLIIENSNKILLGNTIGNSNTSAADAYVSILDIGASDNVKLIGFSEGENGSAFWFNSGFALNDNLNFIGLSTTTNTNAMTWTYDGRIGINTTNPEGKLEINHTGSWNDPSIHLKGQYPTIKFNDTNNNADDWYIHANSNKFYIMVDRDGHLGDDPITASDNIWETPYPIELNSSTNEGYIFGHKISTFSGSYNDLSNKPTISTFSGNYNDLTNKPTIPTNNNQLTNGRGYVTSSGNTVIGTDGDINTSGATVIDQLNMTDGVIQSHSTRTMTLAHLGYTGATNANNYSHPTFNSDDFSFDTGPMTGARVISDLDVNIATNSEGHVTDANGAVSTRILTLADLGYTGATNATNTAAPAIIVSGSTVSLASGVSQSAIRNAIGAGTGSGSANGTVTSVSVGTGLDLQGTSTVNPTIKLDFTEFNSVTTLGDFDNFVVTGTGSGLTPKKIKKGDMFNEIFADDITMQGTLEVQGGATGDSIRAAGDIVALASMASDDALKTNKVTIDGALDKVCSLNGFTFDWNEKAAEIGIQDEGSIGLSAQEIEKVVPEVVKPLSNTEYKYVNYEKLVPVLVEAIKELKSEIEQLKSNQCDC